MTVEQRMAELGRFVDAHPVDIERALVEVESMVTQQRTRRWAGAALVAAAVVAAVVWGAVSLDWFTRSSEPIPVDQPVPTVVTSPDTDPATPGELTGTSWVLESFTDGGEQVPAAAESTLTFAPGGAGGVSTGCTPYRLVWEQDDAALSLSVDARAAGGAACDDPEVAAQEATLLDLLPQVASAEQTDDTLVLLDTDGSPLLRYGAALTDLSGTSWSATGLAALTGDTPPGGLETGDVIATITIDFTDDGTVAGFTGCRDYTGTWAADPDSATLAVTEVTTQGQDCAGESATVETRYLRELGAVAGFFIEGSTLNLKQGPAIDAETLIRYTRDTS
jgi:heat shock protein HslJ